jgi:threonine synthase
VLQAVRESGGGIAAVTEREIYDAWMSLARRGLYVEPTGAVAAAAADRLLREGAVAGAETTIAALTGNGLKSGEAANPPGAQAD